jgi:hypothetical protein
MTISPWDYECDLPSPNGKLRAEISSAHEIAMGAPMWGKLKISSGLELDRCNPSIVWSDDSKYLAIPAWTSRRNQNLVIVEVESGTIYRTKEEFRVLELKSFKDGIIEGVDSPLYQPKEIRISLLDILNGNLK